MRLPLLLGALSGASRLLSAQPVLPTRTVEGGVQVLSHRADALGKAPVWKLGALIGRAGGAAAPDIELTYAFSAALMRDGRLVTLSEVGNRFYRFSETGKFEQSIARQGAGPGEIMAPMGLGAFADDTLFVVDGANHRISWFTPQKLVKSAPIPSGILNTSANGGLRSGELVLRSLGAYPTPSSSLPVRTTARAYLLTASGASARMIAEVPDYEFAEVETNYRGKRRKSPEVLRLSSHAHVVAWDTVVVTASSHESRLELRERSGRVQRQIKLPTARRPVTAPIRDAHIKELLDRIEAPHSEGYVDKSETIRLAKAAPMADSLPAFDALLVSRDQLLWVVDALAPGDQRSGATAFRADGAVVGRLTWSGHRAPLAFAADRVVMRETDVDGVVSLAIYKLVK